MIEQKAELVEQKTELVKQEYKLNQQNSELAQIKKDINLTKLRFVLDKELEPKKNVFEKAINIRNNIYSKVRLLDTPEGFNFDDFVGAYKKSALDRSDPHVCGGLTVLYMSALESQGIPSRYVGFFSTNKKPYDSHASVEFFYNGKWYASDPSFNAMFKYEGKYLSYGDIFLLLQRGIEPEIVSNGFPLVEERKLQNYYLSMKELFKYLIIHPDRVRDPNDESSVYLPSSWDGKVLNRDGTLEDVTNWSHFHRYLSSGVLR